MGCPQPSQSGPRHHCTRNQNNSVFFNFWSLASRLLTVKTQVPCTTEEICFIIWKTRRPVCPLSLTFCFATHEERERRKVGFPMQTNILFLGYFANVLDVEVHRELASVSFVWKHLKGRYLLYRSLFCYNQRFHRPKASKPTTTKCTYETLSTEFFFSEYSPLVH